VGLPMQELEPQTEYVDAIQPRMPAWKKVSIGAGIVLIVVTMALTANLWISALVTVVAFCTIVVVLGAFILLVLWYAFGPKQGPTLEDYEKIAAARRQAGLYQPPVVDGSTVEQQAMVDAIEKLTTYHVQLGEKVEQIEAKVDQVNAENRSEIAEIKTSIDEILTQLQKVAHSNGDKEAPGNEAARSVPPSVPPTKAEVNRAKLVRWVRANREKAQTMDIRKIAKETGVNRNTAGRFITDYREGKITI
jgi:hypothetical protein